MSILGQIFTWTCQLLLALMKVDPPYICSSEMGKMQAENRNAFSCVHFQTDLRECLTTKQSSRLHRFISRTSRKVDAENVSFEISLRRLLTSRWLTTKSFTHPPTQPYSLPWFDMGLRLNRCSWLELTYMYTFESLLETPPGSYGVSLRRRPSKPAEN